MPFDGSGNFNRVMNWVNDALANIKILATRHDSEDDNFASGLSNVICKDGQTSITANIPFNGKRITNLANPVNPQDAMTLAQMIASNIRYDVAQALTAAQMTQAHQNIAATQAVLFKSAAYTLLLADRNKLLIITGTCTIALPSPAAVGADWSIDIKTLGGALTLTTPSGIIVQGPSPGGSPAPCVIPDDYTAKIWTDGVNWQLTKVAQNAGQLWKKTLVASSNPAFPIDPATKYLLVEVQGAGGSGGGNSGGTTGTCGSGGGGGAGGYCNKFFARGALTTAAIVIGAGGAQTGTTGAAGGTSSWIDAVNNLTALGGGGGNSTGAVSSLNAAAGGDGANASGGDLNFIGGSGHNSLSLGTSMAGAGAARMANSGNGGNSILGFGGRGANVSASSAAAIFTAGNTAVGFGAGGGGGSAINTNGTGAGGAGGNGAVIVWEFR